MTDCRPVFQDAQRLMDQFEALKNDVRGTARTEQAALAERLDALPLPRDQTKTEWNIAMSVGIYLPRSGEPYSDAAIFDSDDMRAYADMMNYQEYVPPPDPSLPRPKDEFPF